MTNENGMPPGRGKILRFSAVWCMNCIFMKPVWEEMEKEFAWLSFEEFDADDQADIHKLYGIKDVPTVIFLDSGGKEVLRLEGAQEKDDLYEAIKKFR